VMEMGLAGSFPNVFGGERKGGKNLVLCPRKLSNQKAIQTYKEAIRIKPDDAVTHYNLGLTYLDLGDSGSALDEYKILKGLDQELANKLFNLIYK
jgi:tetratricopeptide (TPR) repeat protein